MSEHMTFLEALQTSLRPTKEAYRMLYRLPNIDKIPLSSSEPILEKFMIEHKDKIICIFTDYGVVLRSDALVIALKSEQQLGKLRKRFGSHNARFIEVVDFEDLMGWRDEAE